MPAEKTHTPRVRLTDEQKRALRAHHRAYPEKTQQMLCAWVAAVFQLPQAPSPSTITSLFKSPPAPPNSNVNRYSAARKTIRLEFPQLEDELVQWVYRCDQMDLLSVVTGAAIREKAFKIRDELLRDAAPSTATVKLAALTFSDSWLYHFQARHGLSTTTATGDTNARQSTAHQKKEKQIGRKTKKQSTALRNQLR